MQNAQGHLTNAYWDCVKSTCTGLSSQKGVVTGSLDKNAQDESWASGTTGLKH